MARRFRVRMKKRINIPRVVAKTAGTIIALYVGNEIINQIGNIMNCTRGPFNDGFKLIGWTISDGVNTTAGSGSACDGLAIGESVNNIITSTSGAGVLAVVGIVGIASIVMEFVEFNL